MGRFVDKGNTKTIRAPWWAEGEEVVIKRFSYGDRQKLNERGMVVHQVDPEGRVMRRADLAVFNLAMMEIGIVEWTLKQDGEHVRPLTPQAIYELTTEDGEYIVCEIDDFNPWRTAEEQESFRDKLGSLAKEQSGAGRIG